MMSAHKTWGARDLRAVGLVFGVALLTRGLLFALVAPKPQKLYTPDSFGYEQIALNLLSYGAFSDRALPPFTPDLKRTPGYPTLMSGIYAITGPNPEAVILAQLVLAAATVVLVYVLSRQLSFSGRAAVVAALVVALEPVSAMTSSLLLSETLFVFLLLASLVTLVVWRGGSLWWLAASAVLLGLASLTRPVGQFLPFVLTPAVVIICSRHRAGRSLLAGALFLVLSLGVTYSWAYQNYRVSGQFTLSTVTDENLLYYRARDVLASARGMGQKEALAELQARASQASPGAKPSSAERQVALEIFREYPRETAAMLGRGAVRIFADPGFTAACTLLDPTNLAMECLPGQASMNESGVIDNALRLVGQFNPLQLAVMGWSALLSLAVYLAGLAGAVVLFRHRRWFPLALLAAVTVYFVAVSAGAEANSRFRIPIMPSLAVLGAFAVDHGLSRRFLSGAADTARP